MNSKGLLMMMLGEIYAQKAQSIQVQQKIQFYLTQKGQF